MSFLPRNGGGNGIVWPSHGAYIGPMTAVFQSSLPYDPVPKKLPGIAPMAVADWLIVDDAFAGQMAERDRLLAERRQDVLALDPAARDAAAELLDLVLSLAYPGFGAEVTRPDGVRITIDRTDPMGTLGRLVQEDLMLLQKRGSEHCLTAAVLCFPASWTLSEKFLRPLGAIHTPVTSYDDAMARRVQRLFDGVQPDRPLWRYNVLRYDQPDLYQPRPEAAPRTDDNNGRDGPYLRSERQCILRLPESRAVVFSVHTFLLNLQEAG